MNRKLILFVVAAVVIAALPAVGVAARPTGQGETLKIGLLTDQSGVLQLYGVEQENGFRLGLEYATDGTMEVAGRPIEVVVRDNAGDADVAAQQARELIEVEGVELLFGAPSSGVTQGLVNVADEYDIILMIGPAADPRLTGQFYSDNTFRACRNSFHDAFAIASWAIENVGDTYIQLAPDYAFGQGSAAAFEYAFTSMGATFVQDTIFAPVDTTDFTQYAQQILESGADGVIITWAGDSSITLFEQLDELGVMDQMGVITGFNSNDIVRAWSGPDQIGNVGLIVYHWSLPDTDANWWLVGRHMLEYRDVPDLFTECGFATAQALVAALEITGGDTSTDAMRDALEGLEWDGPKGHYTMRAEDHQALMPMYVVRLITLSGPFQAYYELVDEVGPDEYELPCLAPRCATE